MQGRLRQWWKNGQPEAPIGGRGSSLQKRERPASSAILEAGGKPAGGRNPLPSPHASTCERRCVQTESKRLHEWWEHGSVSQPAPPPRTCPEVDLGPVAALKRSAGSLQPALPYSPRLAASVWSAKRSIAAPIAWSWFQKNDPRGMTSARSATPSITPIVGR